MHTYILAYGMCGERCSGILMKIESSQPRQDGLFGRIGWWKLSGAHGYWKSSYAIVFLSVKTNQN